MKVKSSYIIIFITLIILLAALWQYGYKFLLKTIYPTSYSDIVLKYSDKNNISAALVFAVIKNESNFRFDAKSDIGAMGLMQLTPDTFNWVISKNGNKAVYYAEDLNTPEINIEYGTLLLSLLLREYHHDETTALSAYHAGRTNVNRWLKNTNYSKDGLKIDYIPFNDTRGYVKKVLQSEKMYNDLYFNKK